jgi:DNA-binding response OmpR family regulator
VSEDHIQVLVIDDDPAIVEMIQMGLGTEGMQVTGASDGAEGVAELGRHRFDVVVLDIMMPHVDGWMALMEIRTNPATANLPVIVLTAKTEDLAKIHAFRQGVQQYVTKPFNIMELAARIESLVRGPGRRAAGAATGEMEFRKLAVRKGGRTVLLSIDDIVYLSARNKSTYAHTFENQYLVDQTLIDLEERLAHDSFTRVHRSYVVNLNRVKEIQRVDGSYVVVVADRDETHVPVARRQVRDFREAVGI